MFLHFNELTVEVKQIGVVVVNPSVICLISNVRNQRIEKYLQMFTYQYSVHMPLLSNLLIIINVLFHNLLWTRCAFLIMCDFINKK